MCIESCLQGFCATLHDLWCSFIMHHLGGKHADAGMTMLRVVPAKEWLAKGSGILQAAEPLREVGAVLEGFELCFGIRIIIRVNLDL